jgi:predicted phage terminase large subunit-like protein
MTPRVEDAVLRHSIEMFSGVAFEHLKGQRIDWAPYLFLLLSKLEQARRGEINRLIITLPPRLLKSFFISIVLPSFILGHRPNAQIMCVSYAKSLADEFAEERKRWMSSARYRAIFGEVLKPRTARAELRTTSGGICRAVSMESGVTGKGADFIILDDPQMAQAVRSATEREKMLHIFQNALLTRLNDPATGCIILVMQRLHEDDLVGQVLRVEGMTWDVLNLPAEAEADEEHEIRLASGTTMFRRREGDLLHPRRLTREKLDELKRAMPMLHATQYQQRPAPADGSLVRRDWFRRYDRDDLPDAFDEVLQSWDTANVASHFADWSVCTTWGRLGKALYLLHVHREKLSFPELVRCVRRLDEKWRPDLVLVEDQASGTQVVQLMREQGMTRMRAVKPKCDKETRLVNQTAVIEAGFVWLPKDASWVENYLHELVVFPNGRNDDQVDSTSQALAYLTGWDDHRGLKVWLRQEIEASAAAAASPGRPINPRPETPDEPPDRVNAWKRVRMNCTYYEMDGTCRVPGPDGTVWILWCELRMDWEEVDRYHPANPHNLPMTSLPAPPHLTARYGRQQRPIW